MLLAVMLIVFGGLFAEESVLIDFTHLTADIIPPASERQGTEEFTQNRSTMMDYSRSLKDANSYTEAQQAVMKTSLAIRNWDVQLASSSKSVARDIRSYTEEAESKLYGKVMGIRVNFPTEPWHSWAMIKPPFEIPAFELAMDFDDEGNPVDGSAKTYADLSRFEGPPSDDDPKKPQYGLGVVKNVGAIKSVAVNAYGLNFPHSLSVILIDSEGTHKTMFVDYLNFDGWAELRWDNPAYVQQVRNRELRLYPLYPTTTPFVKFGGFLIKRDPDKAGGDFITYIRDVKIIYDKAVLDPERDIDDEGLWHIIRDREDAKKQWEMSRFGQQQILRYLEKEKQATETAFTPSPSNQQQQ
jgi:hypothetical protein